MKSALDTVFAARTTVAAIRAFARTVEMTVVDNLGTEDTLSDVYVVGDHHSMEIAVIYGNPVAGSVAVSYNLCSKGETDATIVADTRIGSGKWSFHFKVEEGHEKSEGARQATAIATAMGLEKDEIMVVEGDDEAMCLIGVPAGRMIELATEERAVASAG